MSEDAVRSQIERARAGDRDAFGEIYDIYRTDVYRLCRRLLGDEVAAEDAVGETFVRVRGRLVSYEASRPFRSWLLGVAAHYCVDLLRRRSTEQRIFEDHGADLADQGPSPLRTMIRAEERHAVLAAVEALPPKYRLPLVLRHFAELDYQAIGEILGVSRNQVGTLLFRAKQRLRSDLGGRVQ
jgi:RNA polymerase sigma-70 factor (ECF subfamily)